MEPPKDLPSQDETESRQLALGTLHIYPGESPNAEVTDFLGNLISLTSRGYNLSQVTKKGIKDDLYFMLKSKKLRSIELCLNGSADSNYVIKIDYPDLVTSDREISPIEDRINILRVPLLDFDENTMVRNMMERVPEFRFNFDSLSDDSDKLFMSGIRSKTDPNVFVYKADNLVPPES